MMGIYVWMTKVDYTGRLWAQMSCLWAVVHGRLWAPVGVRGHRKTFLDNS